MKVIALFLLSWNVAFTAKYYMELDHFLHRGVLDFPDYGGILTLQGVLIFYNDKHGVNVQHDWVKELIKENTQFWETFVYGCLDYKPAFRAETANFSKQSNQSEGNEIIQQIIGCDWDDEIHKTYGHIEYGNNGEDFITLDVKTGTWIATNLNAEVIAKEWNENKALNHFWKSFLQNECLTFLKMFLRYGKTYLSRKGPLTTTSIAVIATIGCVIAIIIVALSFTAFRKRNDKTLEKLYCFTHMTNSTDRCSTPSSDTVSL